MGCCAASSAANIDTKLYRGIAFVKGVLASSLRPAPHAPQKPDKGCWRLRVILPLRSGHELGYGGCENACVCLLHFDHEPRFPERAVARGVPKAPMVVAGIAWDGATTNRPGARFGPFEIRRASQMLCDAVHPLFGRAYG